MAARWIAFGMAASVAVHAGAWAAMSSIPKDIARHATVVTVFESKKPKAKVDAPKPPEPEPPKAAKKAPKPAAPAPENTPPPPMDTPPPSSENHQALNALPDFGLSLGGGEGTLAIPMGPGGASAIGAALGPAHAQRAEKTLKAAAPRPKATGDIACDEEPTKPKPLDQVRPQYTDEARSANIEGKVILRVTIDPTGKVTNVEVVKGLGHGLDEAAIAALRKWKFQPSMACGHGFESTFTIATRFDLTE